MAKRSYNNSSGRRAHGGKPYDPNNSFVKKMATKVTDFIPQRLWLSKWFNSPTSNGDLSPLTDGEMDNRDDTGDTMLQPPAKRPRIRMDVTHPPGTFKIQPRGRNLKDQYPLQDDTVDFLETDAAGPSGLCDQRSFISSTPAISLNMVRSNLLQADLVRQQNNGTANGIDENSESGESTSGCSSLIPQASRQEGLSPFHRKGLIDDKLSYTNHLQSPRSLFIDSISSQRESLSSRRPSFNASMVNNEGHPLERGGNVLSSPFYSGNITFGGANAAGTSAMRQNRRNLAGTSEFQLRVPRRSSVQVRPTNPPGVDSSGMSQTAKRILEALEHFSSPISDAKKIPVKTSLNSSLAKKRGRDEAFDQSTTSRVGLRHLTRELAVPTVPDMLKLKRRQRLQDTTLAARRIITAHGGPPPPTPVAATCAGAANQETSEYHLRSNSDSQKFFGKLRAKGKKKPDFEEQLDVVNLPSISLPITSLPSFDIPLPKLSSSVTSVTSVAIESKLSSANKTFKFSSPIKLQNDSTSPVKSINHFTFSKPLSPSSNDGRQNQRSRTSSNAPSSPSSASVTPNSANFTFGSSQPSPVANFIWAGSSTAPRPKEPKQVEKKQRKENLELKSGSVMDVLSRFAKPTVAIWECSDCLVKNNENEDNCAACKAPRKKDIEKSNSLSTNISSPSTTDSEFGIQFKMSTDKWECQCCLVRNPVEETKCVSCMTPKTTKKPESQRPNTLTSLQAPKSDLDKFKPAKDSWECSGCMLRNPSDVISCPCCNAAKPGLLQAPVAKTTQQVVSPLMSTTNTTKTWECPSCMVRNAMNAAECVCCSTSNPNATSKSSVIPPASALPSILPTTSGFGDKFKIPTGAWSCDTCMVQNKSEANNCVACGELKPGATASQSKTDDTSSKNDSAPKFNFGIPSSTAPTFQFGIPSNSKPEDKAKTEAPTNGFTFDAPATQSSQTFTFGIPKVTQAELAKTVSFTFAAPKSVEPFKSEEKKAEIPTLFNSVSDTKVGFSFSKPAESKADTPKELTPVVPVLEKAEPPKSVSFGAPAITPKINTQSTPDASITTPVSTPSLFTFSKQPASTPSATVLPFGQTITSVSHETPKSDTSEIPVKPVLTFGKTEPAPSVFGNTEVKPAMTFGTAVNSTEKPAFPVETKLPSFGTIEAKPSMFGNGDKPMFSAPTPAATIALTTQFGVPAVASTTVTSTPTTPASLFSSASTSSIFGNATPNFGASNSATSPPNMFTPKPVESAPAANPGLFTFGASSATQATPQPATGGFNFSGNNGPKPMLGFSANQTTPQAATGFGGFGTPTPTPTAATPFGFNAPKPEAPLVFGQTPSTPGSSIFGNSQPSPASVGFMNSGSQSSGSNVAFNFGSSAPPSATPSIPSASSSGGFNFSAAAASGFSFNAPAQPSFNFTGGNAPTTFNATPQAATTPTTRKIKKAVRRMLPRP